MSVWILERLLPGYSGGISSEVKTQAPGYAVLLASHTPCSREREVVAYSSTGLTLMPRVLMPGAQVLEVGESFR